MPVANEDDRIGRAINMTREPQGPKKASGKGSMGDQALMDAIMIVIAAWVIVILVGFSLRSHSA